MSLYSQRRHQTSTVEEGKTESSDDVTSPAVLATTHPRIGGTCTVVSTKQPVVYDGYTPAVADITSWVG